MRLTMLLALITGAGVLMLTGCTLADDDSRSEPSPEPTEIPDGSGHQEADDSEGFEAPPTVTPEANGARAGDDDQGDLNLNDGFEPIAAEVIGSFDSRPILPDEMRPPVFHLAEDQQELETGWEMYHLQGEIPTIDWESDSVLFMGLSESGSCPWTFTGLSAHESELFGHLGYDVDHPDGQPVDCTADDNPRTFVLLVDQDALSTDEMIVRLVHEQYDYFPLQTDTRDMPLNSIDSTRHDYPFDIWTSDDPNGSGDHERVVEWAEVVALDEDSIALRFGFRDAEMVPDIENPEEFEILEPTPEYVHTRIGMTVRDASLGFPPPDMPSISTAPYREVGVAGRDYHHLMAMATISLHPRADDVGQWSDVQLAIPLLPEPDELSWEVAPVAGEHAIEVIIEKVVSDE